MARRKRRDNSTPAPVTDEIATIQQGRDITRPWIEKLLRPADRILWEKGAGDLELWEELLTDDQVQATTQQRFSSVVACETEVRPGGTSEIDIKAAEFIQEQIKGIDWDNTTQKMLYGIYYGFSIGECLWMHDGTGMVCFDDSQDGKGIKVRNRRRFKFDAEMKPRLLTVTNLLEGEVLPPRKFWGMSVGADNDDEPYGKGLAHWAYWPVFFKRNDVKFWLTFLEKFGSPTAIAKYDPGTPKADQDKLLKAAAEIMSRAAVKMPKTAVIELLEASRSGTADYQALHAAMDKAIAKIVLSQTMTTEDGSSRSQAQVHQDVAQRVIKADADIISQTFNRSVVRWLVDWNFPGAAYPEVWRQTELRSDLRKQVYADRILSELGYKLKPEYVKAFYGDNYIQPELQSDQTFLTDQQTQQLTQTLNMAIAGRWSRDLLDNVLKISFPTLPTGNISSLAQEVEKIMGGREPEPINGIKPFQFQRAAATSDDEAEEADKDRSDRDYASR
jgi:phage gp29-like protein